MSRASRPSVESIRNWQSRQFGMFIHWGLYSIPGGVWNGQQIHGYNEQIRAHAHISREDYAALAQQFNPVKWDPDTVAQLAVDAGMKFIVLTSKHHDGFSLFKTNESTFNVVDGTPYATDVVKGLADACARHGLKFGVYFSTIDWHFEGATGIDYGPDGVRNDNQIPAAHADLNVAQLTELMTGYGPIAEVWFDMGSPTPEQSALFTDTVHSHQQDTMVSGRVFNYEGDFTVMGDNEIPPYLLEEPWQSPASIYHETWGYRSWQVPDDLDAKVREHLVNLIRVVSRGGNYLLNIGPRGDGSIVEFEAAVLRAMGNWIDSNSEALTNCEPQPFRNLDFGACSVVGSNLYLFVLNLPAHGRLHLPGLQNTILSAQEVGSSGYIAVELSPTGATLCLDSTTINGIVPVIRVSLDGSPQIQAPSIAANELGVITLTQWNADVFYRTNGRGYYDGPKPYRLRWQVEAPVSSSYLVEMRYPESDHVEPAEVQIVTAKLGDEFLFRVDSGGIVEANLKLEDLSFSVDLRVLNPDVRGSRLQPIPDWIRFTPVD